MNGYTPARAFRPQDLGRSCALETENLRDQIASLIERYVADKRLQAGDRLPSERELAKQLGVSRTPVREAIRLLEQRGLVEMRVGSGTYVIGISPSTVAESIERYCSLSECSFEDVVAVRGVLEPAIAALAAARATPEDLATLRELVEEIEESFSEGDMEGFTASDSEFHMALAVASHNDAMIAIAAGLHRLVRAWMRARWEVVRERRGAFSHRAVCEAVLARDPVRARSAMIVHEAFRPR
jgi:GntR family transcriptional repressor for pyruvate dehydrogenase complex